MSTATLTGTDVSLEIAVSEALDELTPCQSQSHPLGTLGHAPEESATWLMVPSCGHDRLLCNAWKVHAQAAPPRHFKCSQCPVKTPVADLVFISLDITL